MDGGTITRTLSYAADGSVTSDDRGADLFDLTYDAAGRLAEVERNSILEASYAYDAFGCRVGNRVEDITELEALRTATQRGRPFGGEGWREDAARRFGLDSTLRPRGRPPSRKGS